MIVRFLNRISLVVPVLVLSLLLSAALFPWLLAPVAPGTLDLPYLQPDARHLLGTDNIGQDLLSELIYSARISLCVAFLASITATFLGTLAGMVSGYGEGAWDRWLMRVTDVFLLVPALPLIILLSAYMDAGVFGIALVIGVTAWPATARVVRANVRQERGKNYIRSAQAFGAGNLYVMTVHILPNISQLVLAKGTLVAASAMVAEAGVSFLGLGDPGYKSWGAMLHEAFTGGGLLNGAYLWYMSPIVCISLTVLCLTLLGQRWIEADEEDTLIVGARGKDVPPSSFSHGTPRLRMNGLSVDFVKRDGTVFRALDRLEMSVNENERLAIVGETGSGKSILLLALMGLLPRNAAVTGEILLWRHEPVRSFGKRVPETPRQTCGLCAPGGRPRVEPHDAGGVSGGRTCPGPFENAQGPGHGPGRGDAGANGHFPGPPAYWGVSPSIQRRHGPTGSDGHGPDLGRFPDPSGRTHQGAGSQKQGPHASCVRGA